MNRNNELSRRGAKRKVLVVEDVATNRELLCFILEDYFEVLQACNGLEGLDMLDKYCNELSLVLLDVYMPECDGFEFLRRKREDARYESVPVIVTTASDSSEDEITCLQLGANDFVVKPYNNTVLLNRVNNMVRFRESASMLNLLTWDSITGLYSKEFFYQVAEDTLVSAEDAEYDLVCSDIDGFRVLNDRYGDKNCDKILHDLANAITDRLPGLVAGGRIEGDVFAFLIAHQQSGWESVLYTVTDGFPFANVNVKFGLVENVDHEMTAQKAYSHAMSALETTKGLHGVEVALFDDEVHQRQLLEQTIRESMERALGQLEFSVFYQPKHDVKLDRIGGAEALVRWFHPEIGFISPALFIPIFERSGFITKLDAFVWEEACREINRCRDMGLPVVPISINVSRIDFDSPDLPSQIASLADKHGVDHSLLHIELTETAYSDNPEAVCETLKELKRLGFSTELDDFGAGYSSLVSLNTLPLDVMKLDMSMIRQATALNDFRIVESTIRLAQVLGLKTVVEGVETSAEAERVKEMGCDLIQGYYYSKPLCQTDFEEYLSR